MHPFLYGTAWKKERTAECTARALEAGFTAIDTANQLKHYYEAGVGEAIRGIPREQLFLQTKFTSVGGQDHRLPYDPGADRATQVRQSFASSLDHLGVEYLDSYIVHGPDGYPGLSDVDWETWRELEALHAEGKTKHIGISNVSAEQLEALAAGAGTKPHFVQNRCFASRGWDADVRRVCEKFRITYQGFSLLTANVDVLRDDQVAAIALRIGLEPAQVIFAFARQVGMLSLTGSTSREHLADDLRSVDVSLTPNEIFILQHQSASWE